MLSDLIAKVRRRPYSAAPPGSGPRPATQPRAADAMKGVNTYSSHLTDEEIAAGKHRQHVGGAWDEIGRHQFDYLVEQGLAPEHRLLDVGCGAMRGGIHFAAYLDPGNYYGIDINERLLDAARQVEIPAAGLTDRVPADNLRVSARFEAPFGVQFDYALAQSVFSHLPLNHIRLCLHQLAPVMSPGGRFFATFFHVPDDLPYDADQRQVHVTSHVERDPFHYRVSELEWAAGVADWEFHYIGDWGHPRGQQIVEFRKPAAAPAKRRARAAAAPRSGRAGSSTRPSQRRG